MNSRSGKICINYKYNGAKFKLPLVPEQKTIKDLKQILCNRISSKKQVLSAEDIEILDSTDSVFYDGDLISDLLVDGAEIKVQPHSVPSSITDEIPVEITINTPSNTCIKRAITVKLGEKISEIAQRIINTEGITVPNNMHFRILYKGVILFNDSTVKEADIQPNSEIECNFTQKFYNPPPNSIDEFDLFVKLLDGSKMKLKSKESDLIGHVLKKVCDSEHLDISQFALEFGIFRLSNDKSLKDYKIRESISWITLVNTISAPQIQPQSQPIHSLSNQSQQPSNLPPSQANTQALAAISYADRYRPTEIEKGLLVNPDKLILMNFLPQPTQMMNEEMKEEMFDEQKKIVLRYRLLQSANFNEVQKVIVSNEDTLDQLQSKILTFNYYNTRHYRGALFSEEGIPLTGSLAEMFKSKVTPLLRNDDLIYVVLAPFNVDNTTLPKLNHEEGPDQLFISTTGTHIINADLKTSTVIELKQKIYNKLSIPTGVQALFYGGRPLQDENKLLDYNLQANSTLTLTIRSISQGESYGFSGNFYSPSLIHTTVQSIEGIREFRSHMMSFFGQMRTSYTWNKNITPFLGLVRDLSDSNAPLLNSLYVLFQKGSLKLTQKIALEEGMLNLFMKLIARSPERPKSFEKSPERIFEHTRPILSALIGFVSSIPNIPPLWRDREIFKPVETQCQLTTNELKNPVLLRFDDGSIKICEQAEVEKKIFANEKIPGIENLDPSKMQELPELSRQIDLVRVSRSDKLATVDIWTPKVKEITQADISKTFSLTNWEALCNRADSISFMKIYKALELKGHAPIDCLTVNSDNDLIIYVGKNKDLTKPINTFDVIDGSEESINPDDVATQIAQNIQVIQQVITREPKEAIVVLLDISGSMDEEYFDSVGIKRIGAVKAFFNSFADRTMAYDFHHVVSLVFFNSSIKMICDFTEVLNQFKLHIDTAEASGTTLLYDSIMFAVEKLNMFKLKYPKCIRRIICLTDGEDIGSKNPGWKAARNVQDSGIILDSFVVGPKSDGLKNITFAAGGHCYCPKEINEAMRLFEGETILRASIRKKAPPLKLIQSEKELDLLKYKKFDNELIPMELPEKINNPVIKPKTMINALVSNNQQMMNINNSMRLKRIIKEIHAYAANSHPYIQIFPCKDDFTFWKILLKGPEKTPYEGGTFVLYVNFPDNYPNEAPVMRFLTEIYHCNINSNGRICHSVFDRNYTVDTTIKTIFDCIYGLLLTPEPEDPLDNMLATEFLSDRQKYEDNARKLTALKAKKNIDALMMEFVGVEPNAQENSQDTELKIKEFEEWINK